MNEKTCDAGPIDGASTGAFPADPPFVSQYGDMACNIAKIVYGRDPAAIHDWRADGYASADDYRLWSCSTCGLACLEGIIRAEMCDNPNRWSTRDLNEIWLPGDPKRKLIDRAIAWDVLVPRADGEIDGLYYAPFVKWLAHDYGLEAISRPDLPIQEIAQRVATGCWYVMASVSFEIRNAPQAPTHTGGHLILVYRTQQLAGSDSQTCLVFNNSSGLMPANDNPTRPNTAYAISLSLDSFARYYAGRGILVRRGRAQ